MEKRGQNSSFTIKNWAEIDRPREKLLKKGKRSLTDAELLAILIGSGNTEESAVDLCRKILAGTGNSLNKLGKISVRKLMSYRGIGEAKAISIMAAMELGRRRRLEEAQDEWKIHSGGSVWRVMQPIIGELPHEEFWVLYLNNSHKVIDQVQLSKGGITGTVVDIRLALKMALDLRATSIILAHNHPSGSLKPSFADKQLTRKLKAAGESMDIRVLDHVIVTEKSFFSFVEGGVF